MSDPTKNSTKDELIKYWKDKFVEYVAIEQKYIERLEAQDHKVKAARGALDRLIDAIDTQGPMIEHLHYAKEVLKKLKLKEKENG